MTTLPMTVTTLCYLEQNDNYLMMHRVKKKQDMNQDKWIGVGGHAEDYESLLFFLIGFSILFCSLELVCILCLFRRNVNHFLKLF